MNTDRKLVTGRIHTMVRPGEVLDWMLLESGHIADVGRGPAPDQALARAERVDLGSGTVLPVLHDAHVHLLGTGLLEYDLNLGRATSNEEVLECIASAVASFDGTILRAHSLDPDLIEGGRYPTGRELDAISSTVPIFVKRRDGHSSVVNAAAAELLGVEPGVPGVEMHDGRPSGILRGRVHANAARQSTSFLTRDERAECYRLACRAAASRGIGVVHALVGSRDPEDQDAEVLLDVRDSLPIDVVTFSQTEDVDLVVGMGLPRIGGCLLLDGSFSSGTAALAEPYSDRDGLGNLYYSDEDLTAFLVKAHSRGLQIAVHALGERAVGQALACYEKACGDEAGAARHRIEHCELPSSAHVAAISRLGLGVCVQPTFELLWGGSGGMMERRLGPDRLSRTNPFRTLMKAGARLGGGSDSYVTPMDSVLGIHAAVNRPNEAERLSVFDAVSLFTTGAAWLSFDEGRRGTLEAGKEASFTVLDADPFEVQPSAIREIDTLGLFLRGERVPSG